MHIEMYTMYCISSDEENIRHDNLSKVDTTKGIKF